MKKIGGIIALVLGVILLGGGFGLNLYTAGEMEAAIPEFLGTIKEDGIPVVRQGVYEEKTDDIMLGVIDALNETLGGEEMFSYFVNGSVSSIAMGTAISVWNATVALNMDLAMADFMNNVDFEADITYPAEILFLKGISNFTGGTLGFTPDMIGTILGGNASANAGGIIQPDMGDGTPGILNFLIGYQTVAALGSPYTDAFSLAYGGADFSTQLTPVVVYLSYYLIPLVPTILSLKAGFSVPACTVDNALDFIKLQWATKVLLPGGLVEMEPLADGFEVGSANFKNFTQILNLWDETITDSLVDGNASNWFAAAEGNSTFEPVLIAATGLDQDILDDILVWYVGDFESMVKVGVESEYGIPGDDDVYERLLLAQWTISLLEDEEDLVLCEEGDDIVTGFEMHMEEADAIPSNISLELWDETSSMSFLNEAGLLKWIEAMDDRESAEFTELIDNFALTDKQMNAVCDWLVTIREVTIPAYAACKGTVDYSLPAMIAGGVVVLAGIVLLGIAMKKK